MTQISVEDIENMLYDTSMIRTDLRLAKAPRTMFRSYFVELDKLDDYGCARCG